MDDEEKDRWHLIKPVISPDEKIEELKEKPIDKVVDDAVVRNETKETVSFLIPYRKGNKWGFCDEKNNHYPDNI
jgi:hypothetical protein